MEIKIGDFGLATTCINDEERKTTLCGTPNYIAPEVLMNSKEGYSYEIDIWAIGVVLYAMICGRPPFETREVKTTYYKIQRIEYDYPEDFPISVEAKHLIDSILRYEPKDRLSLRGIREHPFVTKCHFIPKNLPVACIHKIITPDELQELEKAPVTKEENLEDLQRFYFEERKSQDFQDFQDAESQKSINTTCYKIIDLDQLPHLPNTQRHEDLNPASPRPAPAGQRLNQRFCKPSKSTHGSPPRVGRGAQTSPKRPLKKSLQRSPERSPVKASIVAEREAYIVKWVDMSQKYGFGYKLSNGCYGILFNDSTTIISYKETLIYIWTEGDTEMREEYTIETYPKDVKYKCILKIRDYIENEQESELIPIPWSCKTQWIDKKYKRASSSLPKGWISSVDAVYLQRWKLNKKCILFRISNQVFQSNFLDNSQIFIRSNSPIACFKSSEGDIYVKNMATEVNLKLSHPSFHRRIEYVRNLLLEAMRSNNNQMDELDLEYEEEEYLYNKGLQTQGRVKRMENKENKKKEEEKKLEKDINPKSLLKEVFEKERVKEDKENTNYNRFSKVKLGSRMTSMMATKYATKREEEDY